MLSADERRDLVARALSRGAAGYLMKTIEVADLPAVLRQIIGRTVFTAVAAYDSGNSNGHGHGLTPREQEILALVARGLSNKAIGRELWVTDQTVKFHLTNVYRKLKVDNRTAAVQAAYRMGLV
jgi:DNA-binding NarL/FixJ family response regulator